MYRAIYELYIHCIYNMYTYVDHIIAYDFNMYEYDPHNKDTIDYIICSNMTCNYNNMSRCIERYVQKSSQTDAVVWNTLFGRWISNLALDLPPTVLFFFQGLSEQKKRIFETAGRNMEKNLVIFIFLGELWNHVTICPKGTC